MHNFKVWFLARKQVIEALKLCERNPKDIFIQPIIGKISTKYRQKLASTAPESGDFGEGIELYC